MKNSWVILQNALIGKRLFLKVILNFKLIIFFSQEYLNLMKLMLRIIPEVYKKKNITESDLNRWRALEKSLEKLKKQLKTSINVSFAFITGSLVNCIRNGDWILLDEINLASSETLECLSTILEPEGSVILLERGKKKYHF